MPARIVDISRLGEHPFFARLEPATRERIGTLLVYREYTIRQIVYFPDEASDYVYWVTRGRVRVVRSGPGGREVNVALISPGEMFGESALEEAYRRGEFAETVEPSVLLLMRAEDLRKLCRLYPDLTLAVAGETARKLRRAWDSLAEITFWPVRRRLAVALERYMDPRQRVVRLTHLDLGRLIMAARETVTAHLLQFERMGMLELAHRRIRVRDPEQLHRLAEGEEP